MLHRPSDRNRGWWNARIAAVEQGGVASIAETVLQRWFSLTAYREGGGGLALMRNMLARTPTAGYAATCAALRDADLTEAARAVHVADPLRGRRVRRLDAARTGEEPSALIPGSEFRLIANAGHLPCIERPEELSRSICELPAGERGPQADDPDSRTRAAWRFGDARSARPMSMRRKPTRRRSTRIFSASSPRARGDRCGRGRIDAARAVDDHAGAARRARPRSRTRHSYARDAQHGRTPDDIKEALLHVAIYGGVPAANTAFRIVKETLKAMKERHDQRARFQTRLGSHPPLIFPPYTSTVLRGPTKPLIPLAHGLAKSTGPVYGHESVRAARRRPDPQRAP